jgi:hypothetical protein
LLPRLLDKVIDIPARRNLRQSQVGAVFVLGELDQLEADCALHADMNGTVRQQSARINARTIMIAIIHRNLRAARRPIRERL